MSTREAYEAELARLRRGFAVGLRGRREDRFRSQEAFADHARLHRTTVGDLEQGKTDPPLSTLLILADAFEITLDELVGELPVPRERRPPPPLAGKGRRARRRSG